MRTPTIASRYGLALVTAVVVAVSAGCTPDTTGQRVEHDFAATFAHSYVVSETLQGKRPVSPDISSVDCHNNTNKAADAGPGSWGCEVKYVDPGGARHDDSYVVLVDALGCYQAFNGDKRDARIVDKVTHQKVPDPAVGFDGCYDVYDGRTDTAK